MISAYHKIPNQKKIIFIVNSLNYLPEKQISEILKKEKNSMLDFDSWEKIVLKKKDFLKFYAERDVEFFGFNHSYKIEYLTIRYEENQDEKKMLGFIPSDDVIEVFI